MNAELEKRIANAAERILTNPTLTANLDDEAADLFLKWAVRRAEAIAAETAEIADEHTADQAMRPRLRAIQRIGRNLSRWAEDPQETLDQILSYAEEIYPQNYRAPDEQTTLAFLDAHQASPLAQVIASLVDLLEAVDPDE